MATFFLVNLTLLLKPFHPLQAHCVSNTIRGLVIVSAYNVCIQFTPLTENTPLGFLDTGESRPGVTGVSSQLTAMAATDFLILIGIFFPSVTGTFILYPR